MGLNKNGMSRYLHLVSRLATYDYTEAFKAWGQFYYVFEDVYKKNQPVKRGYTSRFVNMLCKMPRNGNEVLIDSSSVVVEANEYERGKQYLSQMIRQYGWNVLHHLFEINADAEEFSSMVVLGQSRVYDMLSPQDKVKADRAVSKYKESTESIIQKKALDSNAFQQIDNILELMRTSPELGLHVWKNAMIDYVEGKRHTKTGLRRIMDSLLFKQANYEEWKKKLTRITHHQYNFISYEVPNIYLLVLSDEWFRDYFFKNFSNYGTACNMIEIIVFSGEKGEYLKIIDNISRNKNTSIHWIEIEKRVEKMVFMKIDSYIRTSYHMNNKSTSIGDNTDYFVNKSKYIDFTASSDGYKLLKEILKENYSKRLPEAIDLLTIYFSESEKNINESLLRFRENFDELIEIVKFDVEKNKDILIDNKLFQLCLFEYCKNKDLVKRAIEIMQDFGRQDDLEFCLYALNNNRVLGTTM